jgi:cation-transporting ATPase E
MTLLAIAVYVLAVVARPYNWWKVLLLVVSAGAYMLIFGWPFTQDLFHLDSSNWTMNSVALTSAAVGIVLVEAVSRIVPRWIANHSSSEGHSADVEVAAA